MQGLGAAVMSGEKKLNWAEPGTGQKAEAKWQRLRQETPHRSFKLLISHFCGRSKKERGCTLDWQHKQKTLMYWIFLIPPWQWIQFLFPLFHYKLVTSGQSVGLVVTRYIHSAAQSLFFSFGLFLGGLADPASECLSAPFTLKLTSCPFLSPAQNHIKKVKVGK